MYNTQQLVVDARNGNTKAMRVLATINKKKQQYDTMLQWYHLAAINNDTQAMYCLGRSFLEGIGTEVNYGEALKWLRAGAKLNDGNCYCHLGYMYYTGLGVKKNIRKAIWYYEKASDLGNQNAMNNLSVLLTMSHHRKNTIAILNRFVSSVLITLLFVISCKKEQPIDNTFKPPLDPGMSIHEGSIATTQISGKLGDVKATFEDHSAKLQNTATVLTESSNGAKQDTPPAVWKDVSKWWDQVAKQIPGLYLMKEQSDKSAQLVSDLRDKTADVVRQLGDAKVANETKEAAFQAEIKRLGSEIKTRDDIIVEKDNKIHDVLRNKLVWIVVGAIPLLGIFFVLGVLINPAIGKAGAIGCGVVIVVATFLGETMWMWQYIFGAFAVIAVGLALYFAIKNRNALWQFVQSGELMKQTMNTETKAFLFGNGAFPGELHKQQSASTQRYVKYFKQYVRTADKAITQVRIPGNGNTP